jgi:glycine/D-amino acid oxidase-like deaminating enzyme
MSIVILERAFALGHGSSGSSSGFLRAYYSRDETMELALDGIRAYTNWREYLGDSSASESFCETGALWMLGKSASENGDMQRRLARFGIRSHVLDAPAVSERFPLVSTEPCPRYDAEGDLLPPAQAAPLSALFEEGCGYVDPNACLVDLQAALYRHGSGVVEWRFGAEATEVLTAEDGERCVGVRCADGSEVHAAHVVNAAGPWFERLMRSAGVAMSTTALPTRVQVAHKRVPSAYLELPFVADSHGGSGIYFVPRRANGQLLFGTIDPRFEREIVDPDRCNPALDPDVKREMLGCLLHRLPGLKPSGEIVGFSSMCAAARRHLLAPSPAALLSALG